MSVVARLEVIPTREGSMSEAVASAVTALEEFDVSYETTPTDTVLEADDPSEVFAAAEAAHRAVADERVITSLEMDDQRTRTRNRQDRVASVERRLGHPARRERHQSSEQQQTDESQQHRSDEPRSRESESATRGSRQSTSDTGRYGGPWRSGGSASGRSDAESSATESRTTESRYLRPKRPISR